MEVDNIAENKWKCCDKQYVQYICTSIKSIIGWWYSNCNLWYRKNFILWAKEQILNFKVQVGDSISSNANLEKVIQTGKMVESDVVSGTSVKKLRCWI